MKICDLLYMKEPRKSIFNWNHISDELSDAQIEELKSYYKTYHKKCWAYKQAVKRLKKWKLLGNSLSIIFASGGISLVAISTAPLLIQGWMKHKALDLKIQNCTYAHQSYQHLLNEIKDMMRSGNFNSSHIYNTMKNIDDYVTDNSLIVDKYLIKNLEQSKYQHLMDVFQPISESDEVRYAVIEARNDEIIPVQDLDSDSQKIAIFDDFVCDKNQKPIIDYFIQGRHKNCSVIYLSQSYYKTPKDIRLNCSQFSIHKFPSANEKSLICAKTVFQKNHMRKRLKNHIPSYTSISHENL